VVWFGYNYLIKEKVRLSVPNVEYYLVPSTLWWNVATSNKVVWFGDNYLAERVVAPRQNTIPGTLLPGTMPLNAVKGTVGTPACKLKFVAVSFKVITVFSPVKVKLSICIFRMEEILL
jgi:hypothetical protein